MTPTAARSEVDGPIGPVRWGILGTGAIAAKFAGDMVHAEGASLAAVASRDPDRAAAFAARHGGRALPSYAALVADRGVDAVYVATPNALHRDHALLAIGAGKAVLVEKPFALNAVEAREIAEAARTAGVFCMEAMWTRFLPAIIETKRLLDAGEIGEITLVRASLGFQATTDPESRFNNPELGGGVVLDLGVYGVSLAHFLLGSPSKLYVHAVYGQTGVNRQAAITLGYKGRIATVCVSHDCELANTTEIFGSRGRIIIEAPFLQASHARLTTFSPPSPSSSAAPARTAVVLLKTMLKRMGLWRIARRMAKRNGMMISAPFPGDGYQFEIEEVGRNLTAGRTESDSMPLNESVEVMKSLDRIQLSLR